MTRSVTPAARSEGKVPPIMSEHSRRHFIRNASIGAAAVGAAALIPSMTSADAAPAAPTGPAHDGPFAVWVKNAKTGEIAVLVGENEVIHHDKALAATLARIAARG